MNDLTQTQLKIIVERAVRPVQANSSRKRKMREELLAHVTAIFEEESARLGDDTAALQRTAERFGNPAELTTQLQESVGLRERIICHLNYWLGIRANEPMPRRAFGHALRLGACYLLAGLMVAGGMLLAKSPGEHCTPRVAVACIFWLVAMLCGYILLAHFMHESLFGPAGRRWWRVMLVTALSCLLIPCSTWILSLAISNPVWSSLKDALSLLPVSAVLTPLLVVGVACAVEFDIRSRQEWDSLLLD